MPEERKGGNPVAKPVIDWMSLTYVAAVILIREFRSCQPYETCCEWKKKIFDNAQKCFEKHGMTFEPGSNEESLDEHTDCLVESFSKLAKPATGHD